MDQEANLLGAILGLAILIGVNQTIHTLFTCKFCGRRQEAGIVIALLNDLLVISTCHHGGDT